MIELNKLLPNLLKNNEFSRCLSEVLDKYIKEIDYVCNGLFLMHNLDQFDDRILDEIAKDKSILWYDSTLPIKYKVNIIKNHRSTYRNLGSESAILQLINDYFGSAGSIDNWYDYGGSHHRFRININDMPFDKSFLDVYNRFLSSLSWVKSADTWLDGICFSRKIEKEYYRGAIAKKCNCINVDILIEVNPNMTQSYYRIAVMHKKVKKYITIKQNKEETQSRFFVSAFFIRFNKKGVCIE